MHASVIEGGQEYSSYPERCVLTGERRTLPGESAAGIESELREVLHRSGADANLEVRFTGDPFELTAEEEIVDVVLRHARTEIVGVPYWADSALLAAADIPSVVIGPSGEGEHAAVERVDLASVERLRDILAATAVDFCVLSA